MKNSLFALLLTLFFGCSLLLVTAVAAASTYIVQKGDTLYKIAVQKNVTLSQLVALNPQIKNINLIYPGQLINLTSGVVTTTQTIKITPPVAQTQPVTAVPTPAVSATGEVRMTAYTTGYGWPDNTPPSADISNPVIHQLAGGTGTYADPITLAVGHSIINGQDILDYPQGTKFYLPNLRKYFIVEDTCGDGNQPQNGPCHTGYQGHVWVDMWVGGQGLSSSGTFACEDTVTDLHTLIENPASNYAVVPGPIYNGTCAPQFGETVVTQ